MDEEARLVSEIMRTRKTLEEALWKLVFLKALLILSLLVNVVQAIRIWGTT